MSNDKDYILINENLLKREWSNDPRTLSLFLHILMMANPNPSVDKRTGIQLEKGQLLTTKTSLAKQCGLSPRQLQAGMERLKKSGAISVQSTKKILIISVCGFEDFLPSIDV